MADAIGKQQDAGIVSVLHHLMYHLYGAFVMIDHDKGVPPAHPRRSGENAGSTPKLGAHHG
jgi:hypothetical protein